MPSKEPSMPPTDPKFQKPSPPLPPPPKRSIIDDIVLDGTPFALPAYWRGNDQAVAALCQLINQILDCKDDGRGVANEPWESTRHRLLELVMRNQKTKMNDLVEYTISHSDMIEQKQNQEENVADMIFFSVKLKNNADANKLEHLIKEIKRGVHCDVNIMDGSEHGYIEIGGWIGDQRLALMLMGIGSLLGLWKLLTPRTLIPQIDDEIAKKMAGCGYVSIQSIQSS